MIHTVTRPNPAIVSVAVDFESTSSEAYFLLQSDHHWDNPKSRHDLIKEHLDEAVDRGAGVIMGGDTFCAMQGKYDKRSSKDDVRPEHQNGRYLDSLIETGAEWFEPYAKNIVAVGKGNHETAILKNHETDLTERFVERLNTLSGASVQSAGYGYWVRLHLKRGPQSRSIWLKIFHGSGGGGPVTKGVIQTNRRAVFLPDADVVMSGHVHESWAVCIKRERINQANSLYHDSQWHVCTPTYKEEYGDGGSGWHPERGAPPKPLGAYWLRVFFRKKRFDFELLPAVENHTPIYG